MVNEIIKEGGEGAILQLSESKYIPGRSTSLYKFKASREDQEALVIDSDSQFISLITPDEVPFSVPTYNCSLLPIPKKGEVVSYTYDSYSRRLAPVNPKIFRIRLDLSWKDVVSQFSRDSTKDLVNPSSGKVNGFNSKPPGYWISDKSKNLRKLFEKFALTRNFDPLVASNWYNVKYKDVVALMKMTQASMAQFDRKFVKSLIGVFPDIGLEEHKFNDLPKKYWKNPVNRRKFFDDFASTHSIDPHIADSWYRVSPSLFYATKGYYSVMQYYGGSLVRALTSLYPDLSLRPECFSKLPNTHMREEENRRKFMDRLATTRGLDPLLPPSWYSLSSQFNKLVYNKGVRAVIRHYDNNFKKAILLLYPNIGLDPLSFNKNI